MAVTGNNIITACAVLAIAIIAGFYTFKYGGNENEVPQQFRMNEILAAMLKIEHEEPVNYGVKVAVGYGICEDVFSKGSVVVEAPTEEMAVREHHYTISSMKELKETYALFFAAGGAGERYISNKALFQDMVDKAMAEPDHWTGVGGNAPVMASRFAKEGATVLIGARKTAYAAARLAKNITYSSVSQESESSDIHLILEYSKGETYGGYSSPRANRFIVHSDRSNPTLNDAEDFGSMLPSFNPKLLVVSGLQMMDNFPFDEGVRIARLGVVKDQMISAAKKGSLVHFELASFSELSLMKELASDVIPHSHSIGMNEQELPNLHSILMKGDVNLVSDQNIRVAKVLDLMRQVFNTLGNKKDSKLSRLHVHTLAFQAVMVKIGSPWVRTRAGATKAALTATRHVCGNKEISVAVSTLLMDDGFSLSEKEGSQRRKLNAEEPVACWREESINVEVCVAPVLVCTAVKQTAGAGDNISAAGLVIQI